MVLIAKGGATPLDILRLFGMYPFHLLDVAKCLLLVAILFIGPLFESGVVEGNWRYWIKPSCAKEAVYDDWQGWRNIVVGPASEELVFRSLAISLFLLAKVCNFMLDILLPSPPLTPVKQSSPTYITFVSPLIFGF